MIQSDRRYAPKKLFFLFYNPANPEDPVNYNSFQPQAANKTPLSACPVKFLSREIAQRALSFHLGLIVKSAAYLTGVPNINPQGNSKLK
jgi:hypothetical protein